MSHVYKALSRLKFDRTCGHFDAVKLMTLSLFALDDVLRFWFLLVRLSAMVLTLPVLSFRIVPSHLKIVLVIALSVSLYPAVRTQHMPVLQGPLHLGMLILGELCLGMLVGFLVQVVFAGIQLGGMLMNQQMGLSMANILDPQNGQQTSIIENFQYVLAILLFFSVSAHHWFLYTMAESLHAMPLLGFRVPGDLARPLVALLGQAFIHAVKLAAPVMVALLLVNVAMGIVARLVPQMNVFTLSFPVNLGVGLIVFALALPFLMADMRQIYMQMGRDLMGFITMLGGG